MNHFRQLAEGLWVIEAPHSLMGVKFGVRSTIVRLRSGGLAVISPVGFDEVQVERLRSLGKVEALVAPNTFHHLFLSRARETFGEAKVFLAPGLKEKIGALPEGETLGEEPPTVWAGVLDQHRVGGTTLNEVVFHHPSSGSLVLTDLAFNIKSGGLWTRALMGLNGGFGRFGPTRVTRSTIRDPKAFRASIRRILSWDFDRVIVAHGEVVEVGGKGAFKTAFGPLGAA